MLGTTNAEKAIVLLVAFLVTLLLFTWVSNSL